MLNAQVQIWNSDFITFEKQNNADQTLAANQDRITDSVWITRASNKSIFNAAFETKDSNSSSPQGTLWAKGKTTDIETLQFKSFRGTHGNNPPSLVDVDLVLFLVKDSIYIDIKFTSWSGSGTGGGFEYERATKNAPLNQQQLASSNALTSFPNPFSQNLNVVSKQKVYKAELKDILGKTVYSNSSDQNSNTLSIKTLHLQKGIYFLFINKNRPIKVVKK
jgi:hypothetical protein